MTIPGSWQHVLIVACLLFVIACLVFARLEQWWLRRRATRVRRRYAQYRPRPDHRDSLALFHRLMRARLFGA
jgi:hypothetical protein